MSDHQPLSRPTAADVTAGLLTRPELAAGLNRTERTICRLENAGLPVIRVGRTRLYDPESVGAWLKTYETRNDIPKRGRPAKHAA